MQITRLELDNWMNFQDVDVRLQRRVFLVGPNASGKSNFLDAIRFLRTLTRVGGGFAAALKERGGVSQIRCLAARRFPAVGIQVTLGDEERLDRWVYELRFAGTKDEVRIERESVSRSGVTVFERPDSNDKADPERLTQTYLEQVHANRDFREVADFFRSIQYLHIVPHLVRDPDRFVGRGEDPFGSDFIERVARAKKTTREARLKRIVSALKVAVPQLQTLELHRDKKGGWHLRGKYEHWRPQGAWQTERQFSDGTLRLLGLLWALVDGSGPLLLEEPELSLHPEVVRHLPQMLARIQRRSTRQVILSTHSPDLLRDEGIGIDEVLVLTPGAEGTAVERSSGFGDIRGLLEGGISLSDAVLPRTRPQNAAQIELFGDL